MRSISNTSPSINTGPPYRFSLSRSLYVDVTVSISAPYLKGWIWNRQSPTPEVIAMICKFHCPDRARVNTRRDDDCVKPTYRFRLLEKVISDPKHQPVPVFWKFTV